jgi:hypothetical protein
MTLFPEPAVSRVSGIRKGLLAATRKGACAKGPDWVLNDHNVVCYTEAGLKKICEALQLDQAGLAEGLAAETPATQAAARVDMADEITHIEGETIDISPGTPARAKLDAGMALAEVFNQEKNQPEAKDQAAGVIGRGVARAATENLFEVTLTSVPVNGNRQLLYGTIEDAVEKSGRRRVSVRVRDNAFFMPGFVVQATPAGPNYFNFVGRLPRWRGDRLGFTAKPKPKEPDGGTTQR